MEFKFPDGYIVNEIIKMVGEMSGVQPVIFEMDGNLMAISPKPARECVIGVISYGINPDKKSKIDGLENCITTKDKWEPKSEDFKPEELPYVQAIQLSRKNEFEKGYNINGLSKIARLLSELPDDGKIRIVKHRKSSSPNGTGLYIDEWRFIGEAYTMNVEQYLEEIRKNERNMYQKLADLPSELEKTEETDSKYGILNRARIPVACILTNDLFISLPVPGLLSEEGEALGVSQWDRFTTLKNNKVSHLRNENGSIVKYYNALYYPKFSKLGICQNEAYSKGSDIIARISKRAKFFYVYFSQLNNTSLEIQEKLGRNVSEYKKQKVNTNVSMGALQLPQVSKALLTDSVKV